MARLSVVVPVFNEEATVTALLERVVLAPLPTGITELELVVVDDGSGDATWQLSRPAEDYLFGADDDQEWETSLGDYGRTFPHPYGPADGSLYTTLLTLSPAGDEIIADFATALIDAEELGQDDVPDYLAVSFSSTDYVGHLFGPSSLEAEDNFLRLDRTLARLLSHVDDKVGLANTLVVLSADHGGPDNPGYLAEFGIEGGLVDLDGLDREPAIARLKQTFGIAEELVSSYSAPYIFLNREAIAAANLDQGEVERVLAEELVRLPGIADAISSTALRNQPLATLSKRRASHA